jgi:CheY-like chemotaxis protein
MKEMSPFAVTHNNTIRLDTPEEPLKVTADHGRIQQVLANLVSNACKYSDQDSEVVIRVERLKDTAIVYVQNRGPGIPDAFRPRLFDAFSQADSSDTRAKGGTGLGLNITKQIVTRHEGQIGFESKPGSFTVFWFTLPLSEESALPNNITSIHRKSEREQRLNVLHIEDDTDFAEIIRSSLRGVANVTNVGTLAEARQMIEKTDLDVAILDWTLPDGDAFCLVGEILNRHPEARILGLSARSDVQPDPRLCANLEKSRTELDKIAAYVSGDVAFAS